MDLVSAKMLGAGLVSFGMAGAAIGIGLIFSSLLQGVARNPAMTKTLFGYTIIGAAPDWYKDIDYRARVVRESRTVLREMGLDLPSTTEIRVWDTTADHRYMVLPTQPPATVGWAEEKLAKIVTQDAMIGASRLDKVEG